MDRELERQLNIIRSNTSEIIPEEELKAKLENSIKTSTPLKVKFGIDPTGNELHLGHAVPLRKLKQFQELGHSIEFIIGNFTAKIGDPTGKSSTRKVLTDEDVKENCKTYLDQASKIIDVDNINLHYNADWLEPLNFSDLLNMMGAFSLSLMISREDFSNRLKSNSPISLVELAYPMMQGYDSVHLNADIEIGGTDQKFNLLRGRDLQRHFGQTPQVCLTLPILEGTSGPEKMSKSLNNFISVNETANDMYGKAMSIRDDLMPTFFKLTTDMSEEQIKEALSSSPYEAKKILAHTLTELYHDMEKAASAAEHFKAIFSDRTLDSKNLKEIELKDTDLISFVSEIAEISKSQAKRLLEANAIKYDNEAVKENIKAKKGILKIGKKIVVKVV